MVGCGDKVTASDFYFYILNEKNPNNMAGKRTNSKRAFSAVDGNRDVAERLILQSANYDGICTIKGVDPVVNNENVKKLYRKATETISLADWCHVIYGWLMVNPKMLSITDFYNYPKDNAPFMYSLDEVINFDSDEIYNLLQERISTMMLRREIDREAALSLLKEKYGWNRDNEQNINLNTGGNISFKFGDANLNTPTTDNNENQTN